MKGADEELIQELIDLVERLAGEVQMLQMAVDEQRESLTQELRTLREAVAGPRSTPTYRLSSMPNDPSAANCHQQVNAVDASVFGEARELVAAESPPASSAAEFVGRLMEQPPTAQLTVEEWVEDQEFTPDETVEVESPIHDWFADYLVCVWQGAAWSVVDDGLGSLFLLWTRDEGCFARRLTEVQRKEFCVLAGVPLNTEMDEAAVTSPLAPRPPVTERPASQQTFW
ncbi:MAG: hypothetical protein SGJ19_06850 [Planctomycetia bacterium]|nr:hypothetical protein [Planctomycetia bacterium]